MPTTQSTLPALPFGSDKQIGATTPIGKGLTAIQNGRLLRTANTSGGNYSESTPSASQNQGQEITYVKTTADAHTFTLTGVNGGSVVLTAQTPNAGSSVTVFSDGASWYVKAKI